MTILKTLSISLLTFALQGTALAENTAIVPVPREGSWPEKQRKLSAWPEKENVAVLFFGDSITEAWRKEAPKGGLAVWQEKFAPLNAANFGISGDRTQHALWRIEHGELDGLRPKVVVVMLGTNNTGKERSGEPRNTVAETIEGMEKVVASLKAKLPESKILLLAIFPRGKTPEDPQRVQVNAINAALPRLADNEQVFFLDIGNQFLSADGTISPEIMPDYLHPNERGYRIWADAIDAPLQALLRGEKPALPRL